METLHIRAENSTIEMLMSLINDMSKDGKEIEIIDDISYEKEQLLSIIFINTFIFMKMRYYDKN